MKTIILPCGCHKITGEGFIFSCLEQFSKKGIQGIQTRTTKIWKKLNPVKNKSGYLQVSIHGRIIRVNRLIAINFISNPTALPEVQHINGIKTNNGIKNLKWGNQKDNADDRESHGHTLKGTKKKNAKLNNRKVVFIRNSKLSLNVLAKRFSVSKKLILLVKQNKIWRCVK